MEPHDQRQKSSASAKKAAKTATVNRASPPRAPRGRSSARAIAARYHALTLAAGHITWTTDRDGGVIDAADWYAFTGQSAGSVAGMGWQEVIHPDDRALAQREWQLAKAAQCPYELEYRVRRADGVYRTMLVRGVPVFTTAGVLQEWTGFCTDITARKTAEDERDQARAEAAKRVGELEVIFEAIVDGIIVVDQAGVILRANRAYCTMHALEHDADFVTLSLSERREVLRLRDAQGRRIPAVDLPLSRILRGETQMGANSSDFTMSRLDGREMTLNVSGAPIFARDGAILGGVIVLRDVTQRQQMEQQSRATLTALLKMAEALVRDETPFAQSGFHSLHDRAAQRLVELTRSVFGCLSVGIATINPVAATFTPAAIIAVTPFQEHFWWQMMQRARFDEHFTTTQRARLLAGDAIRFSVTMPGAGRETVSQDVLLAPILLEDQLVGLLGLESINSEALYGEHEMALVKAVTRLAAITIERKRLVRECEEALARETDSQAAQQRMDDFLSVISHELRAPLTLIKGNVQLAQRRLQRINLAEMEVADIGERVQFACELLRRADRQIGLENRLVSDLLDAARMHTEQLDLSLRRCDLVPIVNEIVGEVRQVSTSRQLRFVAPLAGGIIVEADSERIGQVVMNYLTNALKYSPAVQPIEVTLEKRAGEAYLSVRDWGMGLPPAEHERVWERFHRTPASQQRGLGLGLYICRTIIAQHHGRVGLTSAPGQGATFWFTLPLVRPVADG